MQTRKHELVSSKNTKAISMGVFARGIYNKTPGHTDTGLINGHTSSRKNGIFIYIFA